MVSEMAIAALPLLFVYLVIRLLKSISETERLIAHQKWLFEHNVPDEMRERSMAELRRKLKNT